ncbi:TIGR02996 domain-containing protein [Myxococcus sp. K38C18041901]|uniref:TIGR02996 domain-containing protein n=1 Tax=Myxococcus guangdongensis TaxID=2906760 RepID=UPI0020A82532|nr:TIGR02996 domain-containing protein [Myxococcus guangdongensis]MCP3062917.1 TIGR02996 domain-containing protein [Myxococcus guangdongensis]
MAKFDYRNMLTRVIQVLDDFFSGFDPVSPAPAPTPAPVVSTELREPELEAAILRDPENDDAYLIYGDWLQARGVPRGELIALQHAVLLATAREKMGREKEVSDFFARHAREMFGELYAEPSRYSGLSSGRVHWHWHLGFIQRAWLGSNHAYSLDVPRVLTELLTHPSARFLRALTVGLLDDAADSNHYEGIIQLIARYAPATLRELKVADVLENEFGLSRVRLGDVSSLYTALPRLHTLTLRGDMVLGAMHLPDLRELTIETSGLSRESLRSILSASWPNLEKLELWFGVAEHGGNVSFEDVRPLLEGTGMPRLVHLGLCNAGFTDAVCEALPSAPVLRRLTRLDLSLGTMTSKGAAALVAGAGAFAHLEMLVLTDNLLDDASVESLESLCPQVWLQDQRDDDGSAGNVAHRD